MGFDGFFVGVILGGVGALRFRFGCRSSRREGSFGVRG